MTKIKLECLILFLGLLHLKKKNKKQEHATTRCEDKQARTKAE